NAGRGVRLRVLFRMTDYPRDMMVTYAQGHSVCRFLLLRKVEVGMPVLSEVPHVNRLFRHRVNGHQLLLTFIEVGMAGNTAESWDQAAKDVYGFATVDALEQAWLDWMKTPASRGIADPKATPPTPPQTDLIPPVKLTDDTPRPRRPS